MSCNYTYKFGTRVTGSVHGVCGRCHLPHIVTKHRLSLPHMDRKCYNSIRVKKLGVPIEDLHPTKTPCVIYCMPIVCKHPTNRMYRRKDNLDKMNK